MMINVLALAFAALCTGYYLAVGQYGWAAVMGIMMFINILLVTVQLND